MIAIDTPDGSLTYDELDERACAVRIAAPRVALALPPGLDFAVALRACLLAGVQAVPVDLREPSWRLAGAGQVISQLDNGEQEKGAGFSLIVHTSGTTGAPQPICLSHAQIRANSDAVTSVIEPGRWLCPLPLSHIGGLMVLLRSWLTGTTAVLGPATREDVTVASLVPTQLARLIDRPPPPSLRCVMLGGAPADPTLLVRARDAGWPVRPSYGLTQACSAVTLADVGDVETSGRPLPGVDITLADDGEIIVAGPSVAGGIHATGDLGAWLGDRLVVHGRKVDTIVSGGENVMPQEVEAVLLSHPAVAEAAVFGRPDPEWGEAVTAAVVLRAEAPDLRDFARARLAAFKVPKTIEYVTALPRNAAGKVLRRDELEEPVLEPGPRPGAAAVVQRDRTLEHGRPARHRAFVPALQERGLVDDVRQLLRGECTAHVEHHACDGAHRNRVPHQRPGRSRPGTIWNPACARRRLGTATWIAGARNRRDLPGPPATEPGERGPRRPPRTRPRTIHPRPTTAGARHRNARGL